MLLELYAVHPPASASAMVAQFRLASLAPGDLVKLVDLPPNLSDAGHQPTRTLFQKCVGRVFAIAGVEPVESMSTPLAGLDIGDIIGPEPWEHTIWVEPEYLHLHWSYPVSQGVTGPPVKEVVISSDFSLRQATSKV